MSVNNNPSLAATTSNQPSSDHNNTNTNTTQDNQQAGGGNTKTDSTKDNQKTRNDENKESHITNGNQQNPNTNPANTNANGQTTVTNPTGTNTSVNTTGSSTPSESTKSTKNTNPRNAKNDGEANAGGQTTTIENPVEKGTTASAGGTQATNSGGNGTALVNSNVAGQQTTVENPVETGTSVTAAPGTGVSNSGGNGTALVTTNPTGSGANTSVAAVTSGGTLSGSTNSGGGAEIININTGNNQIDVTGSDGSNATINVTGQATSTEIEPTQSTETTNPDTVVSLPDATNNPNANNDVTPIESAIANLKATVASANLNAQLANLNVASLFQENKLYRDPTGQLWQGTSAVVKTGANNIQFVNASQQAGKQDLSYHLTDMTFNTTIPTDYTQATSQAMRSLNNALTTPTYFLTAVTTERGHSSGTLTAFDKLNVISTGGTISFSATAGQWQTGFAAETTLITPAGSVAVTLYTKTSLGTTYLGGAAPTVAVTQISGGYQITNTYADLNHTQLTQTVFHFDADNNPVSLASMDRASPLDYLNNVVGTKDDIACNRFVNGTMTTLTSENIRILSGLDSILNNTDANSFLAGGVPTGISTGLFKQ